MSGHTEFMRKSPLLAGLAIAAGITILACGGTGDQVTTADFQAALRRLRSISTAADLYMGDYDDVVPAANLWMDGMEPYTTDPNIFVSPAVDPADYGFALNSAAAGRSRSSLDEQATQLIFDSTVLARNATAPVSTQPNPGRYNGSNGILYLDGFIPGYNDTTPLIDQSLTRVRSLAIGSILYSSDYDDVLPRGNWVDATTRYVKRTEYYRTPIFDFQPNQYGYAYNVVVVGGSITVIENPAATLMYFDSNKNERNAVDVATNRPTPGRYNGENAVGYIDGHAGRLSP